MTWKKILKILTTKKEPITGEEIGYKLNLTRSAVWKQIKTLKKEGFIFESYAKLGYKLIFPQDTPIVLDREDLSTKTVGSEVISKIVTNSTNDDARFYSDKSKEGTLIIAEHQKQGRGRRGRSWLSPFGRGLYFSIILKPQLPITALPKMTILVGVAVARALIRLGFQPLLKWPNDIIINNKKVGGILSELYIEGDVAKYVIVGVGLNVHTRLEDFPLDLQNIAGSLYTETGKTYSRLEILKECLGEIDRAYHFFIEKSGDLGLFSDEWNKIAWKKGEEVYITTGKEKELCKIVGLRENGTLAVLKNGTEKEISVGEILF